MSAPKRFSREEALNELGLLIIELEAEWERDRQDYWIPDLVRMLREFVPEATKQPPDFIRLKNLHNALHLYFKKYKFLKGLYFVLDWIDVICGVETLKG